MLSKQIAVFRPFFKMRAWPNMSSFWQRASCACPWDGLKHGVQTRRSATHPKNQTWTWIQKEGRLENDWKIMILLKHSHALERKYHGGEIGVKKLPLLLLLRRCFSFLQNCQQFSIPVLLQRSLRCSLSLITLHNHGPQWVIPLAIPLGSGCFQNGWSLWKNPPGRVETILTRSF